MKKTTEFMGATISLVIALNTSTTNYRIYQREERVDRLSNEVVKVELRYSEKDIKEKGEPSFKFLRYDKEVLHHVEVFIDGVFFLREQVRTEALKKRLPELVQIAEDRITQLSKKDVGLAVLQAMGFN